jgi:hypothetical protein
VATALVLAACSSGGTGPDSQGATTVVTDVAEPTTEFMIETTTELTTEPAVAATEPTTISSTIASPEPVAVRAPTEVAEAPETDAGIAQPIGNAPLPEGYVETEYVYGGEATGYASEGGLRSDGFWVAAEEGVAPYRTRMIVRLPPREQFSGTVLVEWMNVTAAADTTPDWSFLHEEIGRSGHAYVAVSVQEVGVNGAEGSPIEGGLIDTRGLKVRDETRYGSLEHPGDAFAYDIFTQAGAAVSGLDGIDVLDGLKAGQVIALGESQSATFMTTYVNAIHPLVDLYDGFLIHSRGASARTPGGERIQDTGAVLIRTDVSVPVFTFETETDILVLGFEAARQEDSEMVHTWEVAGTAHADSYSLSAATGLPREPGLGAFIGCAASINDGPQHETLQAALRHLVAWVVAGITPPSAPRIQVEEGANGLLISRDDLGIALGGIRTPPVDVPTRVLSGDPSSDAGGLCFLFGQTLPIPNSTLGDLHAGLDELVDRLESSAADAVQRGWLLPEDAATMIAEETTRAVELGFG